MRERQLGLSKLMGTLIIKGTSKQIGAKGGRSM